MTTLSDTIRPVRGGGHVDLLMLGAVVVLWGAHWPVMKTALTHTGPLWFAATRFVTATVCMVLVVAACGRLRLPPRPDWPLVASVGLFQMAAFSLLVMYALRAVPPGRSAVLAYTTSLWVIPLARVFLGERVSPVKALGTLLGLAGIGVLFNPWSLNWSDTGSILGHGILIVSAIVWALCIVHIRGHRWHASALELAPWQMAVAAVPLTVAAFLFEGPVPGDFTTGYWLVTVYAGPIATGFCFWAVVAVNKRLPASTLATGMLGAPVVGILASALSLGEPLDLPVVLGMGLILGGMAAVVMADRR